MTVQLTPQESETHFHNALCNGLGQVRAYGLELEYDSEHYKEARTKLDNPCFEDVLMQILKDGHSLTLVDEEGDEEDAIVTLKEVHERVSKTPIRHLVDAIEEKDDAETADVILQTVFLNDVVYG
jgi:hypothetical protein